MTSFNSKTKRTAIVIAVVLSLCYPSLHSQTVIHVGGDYTGAQIWDADTVKVESNVDAEKLTILPGVVVQFLGPYGIEADTLIAIGTKTDSILFTMKDTTGIHDLTIESGGWKYLFGGRYEEKRYCILEYMKIPGDGYPAGAECDEYIRVMRNCTFRYNYSKRYIVSVDYFYNCAFLENVSRYINTSPAGGYDSCIFAYNTAESVINHHEDGPFVTNCTIFNNEGHGIFLNEPGGAEISSNSIHDNKGTGIIIDADNNAPIDINHNIIYNNQDGGMRLAANHRYLVRNNIVYNNHAENGGGLYLLYSEHLILYNNLIFNNTADYGGGIYFRSAGGFKLINNTVLNNFARYGGGISLESAYEIPLSINLYNNIIRNNVATDSGNQIYKVDNIYNPLPRLNKVFNCNIEDLDSIVVDGEMLFSIDVDTYFEDTANMDYHLTDSSLCINAGTTDIPGFTFPDTDLAGNLRVYCGTIDIGAYEFQGLPVNRPPVIFTSFDTVGINTNDSYEFTVEYKDYDYDDEAHILISASTEDIEITLPAVDTSGSTYTLATKNNWTGQAEITVRAEDLAGRYAEKSFILNVTNPNCGTYTGLLHWTEDTVKVYCDIVADSLAIDPGVVVEFQGPYGIKANTLIAVGTQTDSILFTINDTTGIHDLTVDDGAWKYITGIDYEDLRYCIFEYRKILSPVPVIGYEDREHEGIAYMKDSIVNCVYRFNYSHSFIIGSPLIRNSAFIGNVTPKINGFYGISNETIEYDSCTFAYNTNTINHWWGMVRKISNCHIHHNQGNGIDLKELGACLIDGNRIHDNSGRGIYIFDDGQAHVTIRSNIVYNNHEGGLGLLNSDFNVIDNLVFGNYSNLFGGGVLISESTGLFINNTVESNIAQFGGGIAFNRTILALYNNIIRNNIAIVSGYQLYNRNEPNPALLSTLDIVSHCNIEDLDSIEADGEMLFNIDVDPYFADTANMDYHLTDSSLCINAGTTDIPGFTFPETDLAGNPRVYCGTIDIGVYEFQGLPVNRPPIMFTSFDTVNMLTNETYAFTVDYKDYDYDDEAHILISASTEDIEITMPATDTSGSTYTLATKNNWTGEAEITVRVEDLAGRYAEKSFILNVTNPNCGTYTGLLHWTEDTVKVYCDIVADSLAIDPGVVVEFQGPYGIKANTLIAVGTQTDSILFTINDTTGIHDLTVDDGAWKYITGIDYEDLRYCIFEYRKVLPPVPIIGSSDESIDYEGIVYMKDSIVNCTYRYNYSHSFIIGSIIIKNSGFVGNQTPKINGYYRGYVQYDSCTFAYNNTTQAVISHFESRCKITRCHIHHNQGKGIYLGEPGYSLLIEDNCVHNNLDKGIEIYDLGEAFIRNNVIYDNLGGGLDLSDGSYTLVNNLIFNNHTDPVGGGIYAHSCDVRFINNTIVNNSAQFGGGIAYIGHIYLYNNIIRGNIATSKGSQFYNVHEDDHDINLYYCNIEDLDSIVADGEMLFNIDVDPYFADTVNLDYSLTDSSLCINAGTTDIPCFTLPETDLAGNLRIAFDSVDIGAYEFISVPLPYSTGNTFIQKCKNESLSLTGNARFYDSTEWLKDDVVVAVEDTLRFTEIQIGDEGDYKARYYNDFGSADGDIITVFVHDNPEFILTASPYETGIPPITVEPDATFPVHEWSDGSSGNELILDDSWGYATHTVWLNATSEEGCTGSDTILITLQKPEGIQDNESENAITVVPNPFSERTVITVPSGGNEEVTLYLYNSLGQLIMKDDISHPKYELKNRNYKSGIYHLVFKSGTWIVNKKVIIH